MNRIYLVTDDAIKDRMRPFLQSLLGESDRSFSEISLTEQEISKLNEYPDAECFVVLFCEKNTNYQAMHDLIAYCEVQHIPLIPIFAGTVLKLETLPVSLRSRHILLADDPAVLGKTVLAITHPTFANGTLNNQIREAQELWEKGCRSRMTAQQLFNYAFGLLYGIEVEKDYELSIRLQTALIGNEVFEPDNMMFNHITKRIVPYDAVCYYAEALAGYITAEVAKVKLATDYRAVEKLLGYGYLLQRIGRQFLFNYHVDQVLFDLKSVMIQWCMKDRSAVAGRWLAKYFWEAAERAAVNREYSKMLDDLLEIILYGSSVLDNIDDFQTKLYMLRASSVLDLYMRIRPELVEKAVKIRTLDEYESSNTFRPDHKTKRRSTQEAEKLRELISRYTCRHQESIRTYFKDIVRSERWDLAKAIMDASDMLILCKCNRLSDVLSVWFHKNMEVVLDSIPQDDVEHHRMMLLHYSTFLQLLFNAPYPTDSAALLYTATRFERFYDAHTSKWTGMEHDKSQIYAAYCMAYEDMKQEDLYDQYKLRLFEIVSQRDAGNPSQIREMLIDCYETAYQRMKCGKEKQCIRYISFGWKCCKANHPVPEWLDDVFEAFNDAVIQLGI